MNFAVRGEAAPLYCYRFNGGCYDISDKSQRSGFDIVLCYTVERLGYEVKSRECGLGSDYICEGDNNDVD